jgi:hypothetical protein
MNYPGPDSELPGSRARFGSPSTRRTFMRRAIGGLAIAIPAFRVLSSSTPAVAATPNACTGSCPINHLLGVYCASGAPFKNTSCIGPDVAACMELWQRPNGTQFSIQSGYCFE